MTAASYAAISYLFYQNHQSLTQHYRGFDGGARLAVIDPHYRLRMAGGMSIVVGLLLAGMGFWIASSATGTATEPVQSALPVS